MPDEEAELLVLFLKYLPTLSILRLARKYTRRYVATLLLINITVWKINQYTTFVHVKEAWRLCLRIWERILDLLMSSEHSWLHLIAGGYIKKKLLACYIKIFGYVLSPKGRVHHSMWVSLNPYTVLLCKFINKYSLIWLLPRYVMYFSWFASIVF